MPYTGNQNSSNVKINRSCTQCGFVEAEEIEKGINILDGNADNARRSRENVTT